MNGRLTGPQKYSTLHGMKNQFRFTAALAFAFVAVLASFGCRKPAVVEKGKLVSMNYTLVVDSNVVDSSIGKQPLSFVSGSGQIIPGLDEQLLGMKVGEKKLVIVAPEKGYGQIDPNARQKVPLKAFKDAKNLKPGMVITGNNGGHPVQARVIAVDKKDVTLDTNHPLAGKTLTFNIEIVSIGAAPEPTPLSAPAPTAQQQQQQSSQPH
jgi:FKBP-type peptidyl-prolyl cis-trans isomerase SlyD